MLHHIVNRLLVSIPVLFGVIVIGFCLLQVVPSDPAAIIAGPTASREEIDAIREQLGLNEPLIVQFGVYIERLLQGDLGRSLISAVPVSRELASTIGPTVELMAASLIWCVPAGVALGVWAAVRRGSVVDRAIMAFSVAGLSMPFFWFALILIQFVGYKFQLLPFQGRGGPLWTAEGLAHIVLPAVTLGGIFMGPVARMTRTSVLETLGSDFVRTARAKGVHEARVILKHGLRNALIPIVTLVGLQIGYLLGGAVVTETIFAWPGVGRMAVGAILSTDFALAQGAILVLAFGFIAINLGVDVLYAYLDPRVRRGG